MMWHHTNKFLCHCILKYTNVLFSGVFSSTGDEDVCPVIINADGIYLTSYVVLALNLKLINLGFYDSEDISPPLTRVSILFVSFYYSKCKLK